MSIDQINTPTKKKISQPPLNLLFNPSLLNKEDIWKIDVVKLLELLLGLLKESGNKDLRVCGVAILTSTLIHRLKVESIFKLEKLANQKQIDEDETNNKIKQQQTPMPIPPLITMPLPFRKETEYPVSLEDLLLILEQMITEISNPIIKKSRLNLEPLVPPIDFQQYLIKFEKIIEEYEKKLFDLISNSKTRDIIFDDIVLGKDHLEMARYFIAMLYLAMKKRIEISYKVAKEDKSLVDKHNTEDGKNNIKGANVEEEKADKELIQITLTD